MLQFRSYSEEGKRHCHDFHQLVLPLSGTLCLSVNQHGGLVRGGIAAVVPSGCDHEFAASKHNRFLVADIPEMLEPTIDRLPHFVELDASLNRYSHFLCAELTAARSISLGTKEQMLRLLLSLFQERFGDAVNFDRRISLVKTFMDKNFYRKISLKQLAELGHLSARQLTTLFNRQTGRTPLQYLTELRMREALRLLQQSSLKIQQIGERVGYSSLSSFSYTFSRYFGKSPSYYRVARTQQ